jgi:hypothetical protein
MRVAAKQANFLLPEDVLDELRKAVPKGEQSKVVTEAVRRELKRLRLVKAIKTSFGAWQGEDHPELEEGVDACVRKLRKSSRPGRIK